MSVNCRGRFEEYGFLLLVPFRPHLTQMGAYKLRLGRALEWHSRGQRFDPAYLHQRKTVTERWLFFRWCGKVGATADLLHFNQIRLRRLSGVYRRKGQRFDPAYLHQTHYERLDFLGNQAFFVTKIKYWDDAGSFHRHSSILPYRKAVSTYHADRESGLFLLPEMRFTVKRIKIHSIFLSSSLMQNTLEPKSPCTRREAS